MEKSWMGVAVLYADCAGRCVGVGNRMGGDDRGVVWAVVVAAKVRISESRCEAPGGSRLSETGLVVVAAAAVLCVLSRVRFGADIHSAAVAALILQRSLWHGDASGVECVWSASRRPTRRLDAHADGGLGAGDREARTTCGDVPMRVQLPWDDVPRAAGVEGGHGECDDPGCVRA